MFSHVLLATHGTPGARKAEALAARLVRESGAKLTILSVANVDWNLMTGDDWLNNSGTRNRFAKYVEGQIREEVGEVWDRIRQDMDGLDPAFILKAGVPEEVLVETAQEIGADVAVVGTWQKKQAPGFRARMRNKKLHPLLTCPLLVAP